MHHATMAIVSIMLNQIVTTVNVILDIQDNIVMKVNKSINIKINLIILFLIIDINECRTNSSICHSLANCNNTLGSYICQCRNGYTLGYDQFTCVGEYITLIL